MTRSEFHLHTAISWCAAREMAPEAVSARAAAAGLARVGLADHLWLDPRRGSRPAIGWILRVRESIRALPAGGPAILVGAEADCAPGLGAAGGEALRGLDYAIAAYHFSDVRSGLAPWPATPDELASLMLAGFRSLLDAPGVRIAGHPFFIPPRVWSRLPPALQDKPEEAFALVVRGAGPLLALAAARGVAIELNAKALGPWSRKALLPIIRIARECGCRFALSSDAHRLDEIGRSASLAGWVSAAGIVEGELLTGDEEWPSGA